jgi:hypothetical protein
MPRHDTTVSFESNQSLHLQGAAFPWFDRESYPRILEIMVDHDLLPQSYDRWLKQAYRVLEKARRDGKKPIRAHIDPDRFLAWCNDNGWLPDSVARLAYAVHVAQQTLLPGEEDTGRKPSDQRS